MTNFSKIRTVGGITEYEHKINHLRVLLLSDNTAPVATFMVTYLVGSRNEALGHTGATHILEHLMFKGSQNFNREKGNSIWMVLQNIGARINATTWLDRTNYFEMLPSEHLETAIAVEADRMRNALIDEADRQTEMTVVRNEFERGENDPWESLDKNLWATAYQAHPYHHSTIGWHSDIEGVSIERLKQFYDTFYWPDNAVVSVIGDFQTEQVLEWIDKYFGAFTPAPEPIPTMYTTEPAQLGPRRFIIRRSGEVGIVAKAFKTPAGTGADSYPLAVLGSVLSSGKNSRLYRSLVHSGLAAGVSLFNHPFHDNGLLIVYAMLAPGVEHQKVEDAIDATFAEIKSGGIAADELSRVAAKVRAEVAFSRDGSFSVAAALNEAISMGDWTAYPEYLKNIGAVTGDQVHQAAQTYLVENQSTTGWFIPESGSTAAATETGPQPPGIQPYSFPGMAAEPAPQASPRSGGKSRSLAAGVTDGEPVDGMRLLTFPMQVADVVTLTGTFYGGDQFCLTGNPVAAQLTSNMLDKGTLQRDKFALSEELESVGARLAFHCDDIRAGFGARCLKKDVPLVLASLAEQLRQPKFEQQELDLQRQQIIADLQRNNEDTSWRAKSRFTQILYPGSHPNHTHSVESDLAALEKLTIADLQAFHERQYGMGSWIITATGDLDRGIIEQSLASNFRDWQKVAAVAPDFSAAPGRIGLEGRHEQIHLADKTSTDFIMGLVTGLNRHDDDYLPLHMATYILGGNFSARLMATVRDRDGLTYGIGADTSGCNAGKDGFWVLHGTFAPELLERGREAIMEQLRLWLAEGVTAGELEVKKNTITGSYQVALATTSGMAAAIQDTAEEDWGPGYLDIYPEKIRALTLDQVNGAIRKYINEQQLISVAAGAVGTENL